MANVTANKTIVPFLWYDNKAEEAMNFYTSIFPDSKIEALRKWGEGTPFPADSVMMGTIVIAGLRLHLFDAGPQFKFNESVSFFITCETQAEVDKYWDKLREGGGEESQCGWLKDRFGLSWQVVPAMLGDKLMNGDPVKMAKMTQALWKMKKLDIAALEAAYNS